MDESQRRSAKSSALRFIEDNQTAFKCLSDSVFFFGELGMQEHRSCALMTEILEEHGFTVERGIAGFPTGFMASAGSGSPVIAMHCEYDSNPKNSQRSGVASKEEIVPGAPGHCEGHNVNAAVLVSSALAIKYAMERFNIPGTLKIFGAPAEEQLISRPYFIRDGLFDDVDVAFHAHILDRFKTEYGLLQNASVSADFIFHGESAHAAMWPSKARDALDAVVLMDMGIAQYREHMLTSMTAHRVITHGGDQPNVIPALASVWWYFRDSTADGARRLFEQAQKIAQGAALMTNCEVEVKIRSAVWPVLGNQVMAEIIQPNIDAVGMPAWTEEEVELARALQAQAKVPDAGLFNEVESLTGPSKQIPASNDAGDVSWKVPMARLYFPGNVPHIPFHHWTGGAVLASSIAHKGGVAGAKVLTASCLDFFMDPSLVEKAQANFRQALGPVTYRSLIPDGLTPPLDLNKKIMDQYRAEMEKHYVKERPVFKV
jgi:aminobenzoyl-glutamate utilization protein B